MNPGGEPERDDTGLPPVDIEVPDDARELDRDVQAYRRELRALRRSERQGRWHRSLGRDGVVLPLLACCLILALITGTLLTVFTAMPSQDSSPLSGTAGAVQPDLVHKKTPPDATITVDNDDDGGGLVQVSALSQAMLVLLPSGCSCTGTFKWLVQIASTAGVPAYVIYTTATQTEAGQLFGQLPQRLRAPAGPVRLAHETDGKNLLSLSQVPAGIPQGVLTAVLVAPNQVATWVSDMSPADNKAPLLRALTGKPA